MSSKTTRKQTHSKKPKLPDTTNVVKPLKPILIELKREQENWEKLYPNSYEMRYEMRKNGITVEATLPTILNLTKHKIGDKTALAIAHYLKTDTVLKILDLSYNQISDFGIGEIAKALLVNKTLTSLDLSAFNRGYWGFNLYMIPVEEIIEKHDKGIQAIAEALLVNKTLTSLNLSFSVLSDLSIRMIAEVLKTNKTLKILEIAFSNISDTGCVYIGEALALNTGLETLDISSNDIGNVGAESISLALYKNKTLKTLYLSDNKWDIKGAELIKTALVFNDSLTFINDVNFSELYKNLCIDSEFLAPKVERINDIFDLLRNLYGEYDKILVSRRKPPQELHNAVNKLTTCVHKYKEHLDKDKPFLEKERLQSFENIRAKVKNITLDAISNPALPKDLNSLIAKYFFKNKKSRSHKKSYKKLSKKSYKKSYKKSSKKSSKKSPKLVKKHF